MSRLALGLVHYMAYPDLMSGTGPIVDRLAATARDTTFSVIEVTHMESPADRAAARRVLETAGLRVVYAGTVPLAHSGLALSATAPRERRQAVDFACSLVDEAREIGAELCYLISGPDPGPGLRREALRALGESLREVCRYAREQSPHAGEKSPARSLKLALEPADRDIDHRELTGPFAEVIPLVEEVRRDYPEFGLVVDQSHLAQLGEDPARVIPRCAPYIWDYHLANVVLDDPAHPQYGDKHPRFGVAGGRVGIRELASYLRLMKATAAAATGAAAATDTGAIAPVGLPPIVDLEVRPAPGEDPELVLASAKRAFAEAWALAAPRAAEEATASGGLL